jgi:hypothetical protein
MDKEFKIFINKDELLLSTLEHKYIQFYTTKMEYMKARDEFIQRLQQDDPTYLQLEESTGCESEEAKVEEVFPKIEIIKEKDIDKEAEAEVEQTKEKKKCSTLFKKLVLHIHPDKNKNIESTYFNQARRALEKDKYGKLCFLSKVLHIPIDSLTEEEKDMIQKEIQKKENKINHMNKTYPMILNKAKDEEEKGKIIRAFIETTKLK